MNIAVKEYLKEKGEPKRAEFDLAEDGAVVGHAEVYYGSPKVLSSFLDYEYAYGLARIIEDNRGLTGVLYGIEVQESFRRRGFGTTLIKAVLDYLKKNHVRVVYVQASAQLGSSEEELTAYYEQMGFESIGRTGDACNDIVFYQKLGKVE
jgi:GNAT superfamily N-acetyltransferase